MNSFNMKACIIRARVYYLETLKKLVLVNKLIDKVGSLLPEGWQFYFNGTYLEINNSKEQNAKDTFRFVCWLVEKIAGIHLRREPMIIDHNEKPSLVGLKAWGWWRANDCVLHIDINQYDTHECKLNYVEKLVQVAELDEDCQAIVNTKQI